MGFPETILVKDLKDHNPAYSKKTLAKYEALYRGGEYFRNMLDDFLVKRQLERATGEGSEHFAQQYELRKERADYINYAGGILDWITAAVFREPPHIVSDPDSDYWQGLNLDADGKGNNIAVVLREALHEMLLHKRVYLIPSIDPDDTAKDKIKIGVLSANDVDDWEHDERGVLKWARVKVIDKIRDESKPYLQAENIMHKWIYFTPDANYTYEWTETKENKNDKDQVAKLTETQENELGVPLIIEIDVQPGQWVMDRISGVVLALFNRESGLTHSLDLGAFPQPVLTGDKQSGRSPKDIITGESNALFLDITETYSYVAPPNGVYDSLFKDVERLKKSMYETIQALSINAESIPQAGRLSGEAISEMRSPLETLLASFAWSIVEAFDKWMQMVKNIRSDKNEVKLVGLDDFSSELEQLASDTGIDGQPDDIAGVDVNTPTGELNTSQATVLNGAQVTAAAEIVSQVAAGDLPRESGVSMLEMFFNLSVQEAEHVIGSAGTESFIPLKVEIEKEKIEDGKAREKAGSTERGSTERAES